MMAPAAGTLLRAHRERCRISPAAAARSLGLCESQIHRAERGDDMSISRFIGMCTLYQMRQGDVRDLLSEYREACRA